MIEAEAARRRPHHRLVHPLALAYLSVAWAAGIFAGSFFSLPWGSIVFPLTALLALPFCSLKSRRLLLLICLCALAFLAGILRSSHDRGVEASNLAQYAGDTSISVEGTVSEDPDFRGRYTYLRLSAVSAGVEGVFNEASGRVLIKLGVYPEYNKGDRLVATGKLRALQTSSGSVHLPGGIRTDFRMDYPHIDVVQAAPGGPEAWVRSIRQSLSAALASSIPEPQAAIGQAILLGERTSIPPDLNNAFARTGTTHTLAVSGWNITIVAGIILAISQRVLRRRWFLYLWVAIFVLWLYAALTGLYPPVLRAAMMATVFYLAIYFGRQGSALVAITFAAAVMLAFEPGLMWSVSFQLSFASMAGLIVIAPPMGNLFRSLVMRSGDERGFIRESLGYLMDALAVTLAAITATLPLLAYYFGSVSVVSPLANLALFPALPIIIATSAASAVLGAVLPTAAFLAGWMAMPFLTYMVWAVRLFDGLSFAAQETGTFPPWAVLSYYLMLALALFLPRVFPRFKERMAGLLRETHHHGQGGREHFLSNVRWASLLLAVTAFYLWSATLSITGDNLKVSFLDVGNGDAILVSTPQGRQVLIDGGPDPQLLLQHLGSELPFWDREIDLVVLTHPHADHLTGLVTIFDRYHVTQVLERSAPYDSLTYANWKKAIEDIPVTVAMEGQEIDLGGGAIIRVLHPEIGLVPDGDPDQEGIILRLDYGEVSFLLTGDATEEVENHLIEKRTDVRATILKVAHHGSNTSTGADFLSVALPNIAVISAGRSNQYGLPSTEVVHRLRTDPGSDYVFNTGLNGTVTVTTDGSRIWVDTQE